MNPADRQLLREFWREVRADPVMLRNLVLMGVVVGGLALLVLVLVLLVLV